MFVQSKKQVSFDRIYTKNNVEISNIENKSIIETKPSEQTSPKNILAIKNFANALYTKMQEDGEADITLADTMNFAMGYDADAISLFAETNEE